MGMCEVLIPTFRASFHVFYHFLGFAGYMYLLICAYNILKAKIYTISSDTHELQLIKLHHFKLERFKSI